MRKQFDDVKLDIKKQVAEKSTKKPWVVIAASLLAGFFIGLVFSNIIQ